MSLAVGSSIPLVPQPTEKSCWAASIAMLVGSTAEEVAQKANMSVDDDYGWDEIRGAATIVWGLNEIGPACGGPDYFAPMVERSPLWVVEIGAPYHAVVLTGIYTNGDTWDPDTARVTVNNPWPPGTGAVEDKTFMDFSNEYELGAGSKASILSR